MGELSSSMYAVDQKDARNPLFVELEHERSKLTVQDLVELLGEERTKLLAYFYDQETASPHDFGSPRAALWGDNLSTALLYLERNPTCLSMDELTKLVQRAKTRGE